MFKRLTVIFSAVLLIIAFYSFSSYPIFYKYSNCLELYLNSASSTANIVNSKVGSRWFYTNIRGESFKADKDSFDMDAFLSDYSARVVFIEEIEEGISYYAYSPKIKYRFKLLDKTINLQIFIGNNQVTVGAPIIFGSF